MSARINLSIAFQPVEMFAEQFPPTEHASLNSLFVRIAGYFVVNARKPFNLSYLSQHAKIFLADEISFLKAFVDFRVEQWMSDVTEFILLIC